MVKQIQTKLDLAISTSARIAEILARTVVAYAILTNFTQGYVVAAGLYMAVTAAAGFVYLVFKASE